MGPPSPSATAFVTRCVGIGAVSGLIVGTVIGLVVGLVVHPSTAWFAVIEIGVPAIALGALVGLASGTVTYGLRQRHRAGRSSSPDTAA